ncbi:DUF6090 family protein [uncultured Croceitalea sp.]|uniref:DUF6090 family protein n=1 Tax=uncultured Croceitalea sp. TaxID=1798908 RepID=UPI0033057873
MSKIFRKVRQSLLKENKFSQYFLYAIGEIVLVVIGILLALQINTWNENKERKNEEEKLLSALIEDFNENKKRIAEAIRKEEDMINMSRSLIGAMQSDFNEVDSDSIRFWVASGAKSWWRAEFVTGTYDAIVNSGKIEIIENDELKRLLSQFTADIDSGFEDHDESMSYLIEMNKISAEVAPAIIHDTQREQLGILANEDFDSSIEKLLNNDAYLGLLISKTWLERTRIGYQQKVQGYIDQIIRICQSELTE